MFNELLHIALHDAMRASYEILRIEDDCHPLWIVSHVRQGNVTTTTRGMKFTARSGTVMIHPPHIPFTEIAEGPGTHEVLFFQASVEAGLALFQLCPVTPVVTLTEVPVWSETFDRLLAVRQPESAGFGLTAFGATAQLLGMIIESWQAAGSVPRPPSLEMPEDKWTRLLHYMTRHLGEKIGREDLAARVHLHPGSFNRAFRKAYGQSPMQMLRALRLVRARQMLETTDETLETIAECCGFEEAAYFSRVFHQQYGLPPGKYRYQSKKSVKNAMTSYSRSLLPGA